MINIFKADKKAQKDLNKTIKYNGVPTPAETETGTLLLPLLKLAKPHCVFRLSL